MFARTERLLLRPGWADDAPALTYAIGEEAIVRNLARLPWPYREEDAAAFLARPQDALRPNLLAFARTGGAPRLVGGAGLQQTDNGDVELGFWVARPFWGLGYATESARAIIAIARALRLPEIRAAHFLDNPASGQVLRKLGFEPTGFTCPRHSAARGGRSPARHYRLRLGEQFAEAACPQRELIAA